LIIFSIFLTQQAGEKMQKQKIGRKIFSVLAVFSGFALTMIQVYQHEFYQTSEEPASATIKDIGTRMLGTKDEGYALPFEVISILLLAAMIGCIVIAMREQKISNTEQGILKNEVEKPNS
jgi:NADH-quinone oxidoreductase subunit J